MTTSAGVGAQLRKGVVEYCVLGLLQCGPTYGWKIAERLIETGLIGSIGTLYPLMGRLRDRGLVSAEADIRDDARSRRYYRLTDEGRRALEEFREQWEPFTQAVDAMIITPVEAGPQRQSSKRSVHRGDNR